MRIGFLCIPRLSIQSALLRRPELRGRPLLIGDDKSSRGQVLVASSECLSVGVRIGMAMRDARELVPGAVCLAANPDTDVELFERALDMLDRFAEVVEPVGMTGAWFIPALGPEDERRIGAAIGDALAVTRGLVSKLGFGPGKLVARVAAERAAEGEVEIVPDDEAASYLAPLPVTILPLTRQAVDRLTLLGIVKVGAFARLPSETLPRRFGKEALLAWRLARGEDEATLVPRQRAEIRSHRHTFEPAIDDRAMLLIVATGLLSRLCAALVDERRTFRRLSLGVGLEEGHVVERTAELRVPTSQAEHCLALLRIMVETLPLGGAASFVDLRLEAIAREIPRQESLFAGSFVAERRARLDDALVEISRRYHGHLKRIVPGDTQSLLDERRLLLLPGEPTFSTPRDAPPLTAEPASRPRVIQLLARGDRIYVVEPCAPRDQIVALCAHWEADDWWPEAVHRAYYRVRTRSGRLLTLAHDRISRQWLLVGVFD